MSSAKQQEFIQQLIDKGERSFSNTSLIDYLLSKVYVRSSIGVHRYSFDGHAYLEQIARKLEKVKRFIGMKGGQVALSTLLIAESFWRMEKSPIKGGWYFPDSGNMKIFVQDRVWGMIDISPHIKKNVDQTNSIKNVQLLKYIEATLAFRATETLKQVKTYDSDVNWMDEFDEQNQEHAEFANDRLDHSKLALSRVISQPSFEDFGIHAEYKNSNQEMFLIKCEACNEWNNLVQRFIDDPGSIFGVKTGKMRRSFTLVFDVVRP